MLVLTRHPAESIKIGDNIDIRVLKIVGNQVYLGIDAPQDVSVHRSEVYERVLEERRKKRDEL